MDSSAMEPKMFKKLKGFFAAHVVQDVPAALAACEFGCRKGECRRDTWTNCERRIAVQNSLEHGGRVPNVPKQT